MPQTQGRGLQSLSGLLIPPQAAGYDAAAFRAAGCNCTTVIVAGFSLEEAKAAGYDAAAFRAAGCNCTTDIVAGFSLEEAKAAGYGVAAAHAAGYDVLSLLSLFGYDTVAAAGCDVSQFAIFKGCEGEKSSCLLVSLTPVLTHAHSRA